MVVKRKNELAWSGYIKSHRNIDSILVIVYSSILHRETRRTEYFEGRVQEVW